MPSTRPPCSGISGRHAAAAGEQTSRSQVLAALVTAAEVRPALIAELLHAYRQMPADALEAGNTREDLPAVALPDTPTAEGDTTSAPVSHTDSLQ